jgi:hypothetical protein
MLAIYEAAIDRHHETIRRAEAHARRLAEASTNDGDHSKPADDRPRRRLAALLRRLAGTPATA